MSDYEMFTKEEAINLLEDRWGIKDAQRRLENDKHTLLDDIVVAVQGNVPFQNLTLMAMTPGQRERPSRDRIKRDCLSGYGGLCYTINVFTFYLLKALCYDVSLCHATCTSTVLYKDNHIFVMVENLDRPGDKVLVETGVGFPTFRAVSLDFCDQSPNKEALEQSLTGSVSRPAAESSGSRDITCFNESPVYVDSFLEYKYIVHEGLLLRMHRKGDTAPRPNPPRPEIDFYIGEWRRFYLSDLKSYTDVSEFDACFDVVYTNPTATNFHRAPRALCFPNRRACILSNHRVTIEKEDGTMDRRVLADDVSDDIIAELYRQHFPQIDSDVVIAAYNEWRRLGKP